MFNINPYSLKFQRAVTRALLPIFTIWACTVPRQAHAFVPESVALYGVADSTALAAGVGGASGTIGGAITLGGVAGGAGLVAVGALLGYLAVDYLAGGEKKTARFPTTSAQPVPAPAASATSPQGTNFGFGASSTQAISLCMGGSGSYYSTDGNATCNAMACNNAVSWCLNSSQAANCSTSSGVFTAPRSCTMTNKFTTTTVQMSVYGTACLTGYTLSNGTCNLTDARAATPDKKCDFARSGSALAMISDPDCAGSGGVIPAICEAGGYVCSGQGTTSSGQPLSYVITPSADGGSSIVTHLQTQSGGQTQIVSSTTTVDGTGHVIQTSGDVQPGTIPTTTTGSATTPTTNSSPLVQPQATTQSVTFPTDYARTGEAEAAQVPTRTKLDTIHTDLTEGYTAPVGNDPIKPMDDRLSQIKLQPDKPAINWVPTLLPGTATACHAFSFSGDVNGGALNGLTGSINIDICDKLDIIKQILGYLFFVGTVVFVYRRFTRSNGEAV